MKRILFAFLVVLFGITSGLNAQSRLYPSSNRRTSSILNSHYTKVDSLLLNGGSINDFAFEIRPSFSGETGCYYDVKDSVLVLRTANQSIWYYGMNNGSFKQRKHQEKLVISEYRCPISQVAKQSLKRLFTAAVFSSSFLAQPSGADGVTYEIIIRGGAFAACCWSPKMESNCGQMVEFLICLSDAIKRNDSQGIESLIPSADALSFQFEALYPDDVKDSLMLICE
jgi:hypothetical protein